MKEKKTNWIKKAIKWMSRVWFHILHPFANVKCGSNVLLHGVRISNGGGNMSLGNNVSVHNLTLFTTGKNNRVIIHDGCKLHDLTCWMEGDDNLIEIGCNTSIHGKTQLAACDGHNIIIGDDCLFSHDIYMRTTDSHPIFDESGCRINLEQDITIGNHVWIGMQALILKGATVPDGCIVGARSTVTRKDLRHNSIVAGAPAKTLRENVNWKFERD